MANWVNKAFNPAHKGALHRELGVPAGQKIRKSLLSKAAKKSGTIGRRARLAMIASKFKH